MNREQTISGSEGRQPFDPFAYAEKWYEEHPEAIQPYIDSLERSARYKRKKYNEAKETKPSKGSESASGPPRGSNGRFIPKL